MANIHRIGILTGGGDCPGLNAVIRAVTKYAIMDFGLEVVGIAEGFGGVVRNQWRLLNLEDVSGILPRGAQSWALQTETTPSAIPS